MKRGPGCRWQYQQYRFQKDEPQQERDIPGEILIIVGTIILLLAAGYGIVQFI